MTPDPASLPVAPVPSLQLLGGIALRGLAPEEANHLLAQSKVVALLAFLGLAPAGSWQRRDRIVGLLWPELDQVHARSALRKAIHHARSVLGEGAIAGRGDEELALDRNAVRCDVTDMLEAVAKGRLELAIELYRGDLMPGFHLPECHDFDAWLEEHRAALLEETVAACWALAKHLEAGDNLTEAGRVARKAARLDWSNERVLRRSLMMLDRLGDRAGALKLYEEFARRLRKELEADPSPETARMAESLRSGRPAG